MGLRLTPSAFVLEQSMFESERSLIGSFEAVVRPDYGHVPDLERSCLERPDS